MTFPRNQCINIDFSLIHKKRRSNMRACFALLCCTNNDTGEMGDKQSGNSKDKQKATSTNEKSMNLGKILSFAVSGDVLTLVMQSQHKSPWRTIGVDEIARFPSSLRVSQLCFSQKRLWVSLKTNRNQRSRRQTLAQPMMSRIFQDEVRHWEAMTEVHLWLNCPR